jgi:hypothetical protein
MDDRHDADVVADPDHRDLQRCDGMAPSAAPMNRWAYWHAVLVTGGLVFRAGFFALWGMIGLRMWV